MKAQACRGGLVREKLLGLAVLILLLVGLNLDAQQDSSATAPSPVTSSTQTYGKDEPTFSQRDSRYILRPGDSFDVTFDYTPELNQTVLIQPDGFINLREAGDIRASGLTVPQLVEAIRADYGKVLNNPVISVTMKDFEKPYFIADGQVNKPGKYDLRGDTTVVQAIAIAGGFNQSAKHSQVVLFRRVDDNWTQAKLLDVKKMQQERNLAEDLHLRPGDMVFVPKNRLSKFKEFLPTANLAMVPTQF